MLRRIEEVAHNSELRLIAEPHEWSCEDDWPHISPFEYKLASAPDDELDAVGTVDGYRISHDWTVDHDMTLWDEADALDGDIVRYVEALIREMRSCDQVFEAGIELTSVQRLTIVRHVEPAKPQESATLIQRTVACLAMMDAPVMMLVDPWPSAEQRRTSGGRLRGRGHIPGLLELGFVRMVGSRFLWAWNRELSESWMANYSYAKLLAARKAGALAETLGVPLSRESYGPLPRGLAELADLPDPDELDEE